jgi:uncharacterized protein YecT (DUF1311 family)
MKIIYIAIFLCLSITKTYALTPCQNAMGTWELDECWGKELDKTELKLDTKYKKILSILSKPDDETYEYSAIRKAVISSQKAWLKLREIDCDAEYAALPQPTGNTAPRIRMGCMIDYANRRIKRLDVFDPNL